jgi:hypothetical protein
MSKAGKTPESRTKLRDKAGDKPKKPPPPPLPPVADDYEDGDIATPKFDRSGDDDEPL